MKTVLISFIGKGKKSQGESGYAKTCYGFLDGYTYETAFFGSALYNYLKEKGNTVDKWIIFGTLQSSWSEIIDTIDYDKQKEVEDLYLKMIYYEEHNGLTQECLKNLENSLRHYISEVSLIAVETTEREKYVDKLMEMIPDEDVHIVFDLTHALRHMPVIMAFSLMYVRCFKKIDNIDVYYGAFDLTKDGITPVYRIDFINELFSLTTSYELYKNSGYFPQLLNNLGIKGSEKTYFKLEMNRSPRKEINDLIGKLQKVKDDNKGKIYIKSVADEIISEFSSMNNQKTTLDERMLNKAKFFYDKKQYLIALTLIFEAILDKANRVYKLNIKEGSNYSSSLIKSKIREKLNDEEALKTFADLEHSRNSAVHGDPAIGTQNYLENQRDFEKLFAEAIKLYDMIN